MNVNVGEMDINVLSLTQSKITWVIDQFERYALDYDILESPVFTIKVNGVTKHLIFMMSSDEIDEDGEEYFGIHLIGQNCYCRLEIAILDNNNKEVYKNGIDVELSKHIRNRGFPHFIKKDDLLNEHKSTLINKSKLKIICKITTNQVIAVDRYKTPDQVAEQSLRLEESDQLQNLFLNGMFSDVVFSVEGDNIRAHKCIIANRSPVFEAMFKHDMKEARENVVHVKDILYSTMYCLLQFIYCGIVPTYTKQEAYVNYKNLLLAADKYGIRNLKVECERRLIGNLDIHNVFENLHFADAHDAVQLKESAIDFIASNGDEIIESPTYKEFGKLHPELSCEVFRALIIKRRKID